MELIQHDYIQVDINAIKPYENNARLHSSIQINQIMQSIKEFGFTNPLIIDTEYNLIAGHGRLEALKQLNKIDFKDKPILQVPCIQVKDLSDTQKRALCLADNQIALNSTWDNEKLQDELEKLINENFNFDCLGFDDSVFDGFGINTDGIKISQSILYEPRDFKPEIKELMDLQEYNKKIAYIESLQLDNDFKEFLKLSATRFIFFQFDKIADYFANSNKDIQEAMKELILVILDYNECIEKNLLNLDQAIRGFVNEKYIN